MSESPNRASALAELAALAETAGSQVMEALIQRRDKPDAATFIGSGKVAEVRQAVVATEQILWFVMVSYLLLNLEL